MGVVTAHASPPFDAWAWWRACQETWAAGLWPVTAAALRAQRLAALIDVARRDSPLYRRRAAGACGLADFAPIDKAELMDRFDDWATDRRITREGAQAWLARGDNIADAWLGRYLVWTSSGTSGVPGWFVQDAAALAAYDAIDTLRLRGAAPTQPTLGTWGTAQRFAFVGAAGGHFAGIASLTRLARIVPPPWRPEIVLLSVQQPLAAVATALQAAAPTVLITYPSAAEALASLQSAGALRLALREVWVGGEQLSAAQRADIASGFGCTVRNNYGASECFSIAWECAEGHLHLNEDWVITEPVDEWGRPVPPDVLSQAVLITNLANRVQPLIRYRLDDRVRLLEGRCACGSAFARIEVQGRSGDTLQLPDVRHGRVAIVPLALETAIEEDAKVTQFQVIDHERRGGGHTLELRFEPGVAAPQAAFRRCRDAVQRYLASQGVAHTDCTFSAEAPLRDRASGKLRRIRRAAAGRRLTGR